ncbi:histidine kinase dimerization/phosphoacceptor domain -containing protein [Spirosoma sp. KUDC1026]|uniref:tetratricopeptide repeat-containing sensor histidine kinase n=1 Tax=Spirosoma sp. KUDC1026 TaxID=2745947 RepID=UPI00159BEA5B|nr:histidine kinase dimerization/phosphoacceptor domain -containing protein [Spirosoma sp. KUDC1026]QKZ13849.1 histidine kinase [Spirosoma sp. KUDC1026]
MCSQVYKPVGQSSILPVLFSGFARTCLLFGLLLYTLAAGGQNINRQQVNRLLADLRQSRPDEKRISILLELSKFHIYKPGETKADLDSSRIYLRQARKLSDSLHLLTRQHETESLSIVADLEGGDTASGRARFSTLITNCQRSGDKEGEAIARSKFGIWLRNYAPDSTIVLANFRLVAALYRSIHKPIDEINALKEIGITHLYEGKLTTAESELLHVLKRYKAIRYPKLHYTYNLLSIIGRLKGDLNEGLMYGLLCVETMKRTADTASAAAFYGDLAQVYEVAGNHQKSIDWYKKSLVVWRREGLPNFALFNAAGMIAKELIAQQQPQEALRFLKELVAEIPTNTLIQKACVAQNFAYCYDALQNYGLAERYYQEALLRYEKNNLDFEQSLRVREDIGAFYVKQHKYKEAGYYLTKALTILPQKEALSTLRDIHLMLFKVDSAQGSYLSAIDHLRHYKTFNDSLFNEARSKQLTQLQIQYDTRAKEQNIALLTKQSELQQSALKRAETTRNAILIGALLLAGLLGVSYNRYRLKQRSNQLLEAKQREIDQKNQSLEHMVVEKEELLEEKEWMLKEIHHRVKNNLQIISSLLSAQSDYLHDTTALAAIRESQNRVQAMALIHQRLYQSDHLARVSMVDYVSEVVDYLLESFSHQPAVQTVLDVFPVQLDVNLATPIGLIINEAVTNSLKYAFPEARTLQPRIIWVSLQPLDEETCRLLIEDNGVGLPTGFNPAQSTTLGLTMIQGLSHQIGGRLQIRSHQESGVCIQLDFDQHRKTDRIS